MNNKIRETWVSVQKAETRLVLTGIKLHPQGAINAADQLVIDPSIRQVFARGASCFNPRDIRARDYLVRFPFSSTEAIDQQLKSLVDAGALTGPREGAYALTRKADTYRQILTDRVGASIEALDLGDIGEDRIQRLLEFDHRILAAIRESVEHMPSPILEHRLKGLQPDYDPPKRWHHWQLAWTMIASHEDAEQQVRRERGVDPLPWFARHELWFTARRPHRSRMQVCGELAKVAQRYAPLRNPKAECDAAWNDLKRRGWIDGVGDACRLTQLGLCEADRDEAEIDEIFLSRWPDFTVEEIRELREIADDINTRCEELVALADADQ